LCVARALFCGAGENYGSDWLFFDGDTEQGMSRDALTLGIMLS
jgi:hypothetical protein